MAYTDAFGMKVTYGRDEAKDLNGLVDVTHFGAVHQITAKIDFDELGVPSASGLTIRSSKIPEGSAILDCKLVVLEAAATAATTVDVGTVELDGDAIDTDGLLDGVALSAGVKTPVASEALIGTVVAKDSYIKVSPSASTAAALGGLKAVLIVDYV